MSTPSAIHALYIVPITTLVSCPRAQCLLSTGWHPCRPPTTLDQYKLRRPRSFATLVAFPTPDPQTPRVHPPSCSCMILFFFLHRSCLPITPFGQIVHACVARYCRLISLSPLLATNHPQPIQTWPPSLNTLQLTALALTPPAHPPSCSCMIPFYLLHRSGKTITQLSQLVRAYQTVLHRRVIRLPPLHRLATTHGIETASDPFRPPAGVPPRMLPTPLPYPLLAPTLHAAHTRSVVVMLELLARPA